MKPDPPIQWVTAHQLAVGMTIRCPVDGDRITITELHASSSMIVGIECAKGGCGFNVNDTFELLEPFDLTTVNLDWIKEKLVEEERWFHRNDVLGVAWGTEDAFDKARIEFIPYKRVGESHEPIVDAESLVLTKDAFQSFFKALTDDSDDKRTIDNLVSIGELQSDWGAPILTYCVSLMFSDFKISNGEFLNIEMVNLPERFL